ncbi:hypothetical protein Taro_024380, partial [Colocasia esculenta]|nr:hypothetical protein [Colocasia esculenta]
PPPAPAAVAAGGVAARGAPLPHLRCSTPHSRPRPPRSSAIAVAAGVPLPFASPSVITVDGHSCLREPATYAFIYTSCSKEEQGNLGDYFVVFGRGIDRKAAPFARGRGVHPS